jgi:hypothetical protein
MPNDRMINELERIQKKSEIPFQYLLEGTEEYHKRIPVRIAILWTENASLDFSGLQWHYLNFTIRLLLPLSMNRRGTKFKQWKEK